MDRKKLLAGELLTEGGAESDNEEENLLGSSPAKSQQQKQQNEKNQTKEEEQQPPPPLKKQRVLTEAEQEEEMLKSIGYTIVSGDEVTVLGSNFVPRWRIPSVVGSTSKQQSIVKEQQTEEGTSTNDDDTKDTKEQPPDDVEKGSTDYKHINNTKYRISLLTKIDVAELDSSGNVIDKGDDDFQPSLKWTGRKGGFEFKLGERGLGYYRTGK
eukprot:CAMPEP_0195533326 /NCGR_PEP_ID=MMETSP0794_2-20130614/40266_1 /TAXON_ID=515487 /ORGANISM="Stephanopyxis turris, Strain CCMP 815" /LENGTH=211 /DNA_ID=CAMNT_0040665807 /DNA_START=60 /DNA_END=692 /DNA_ORIENTATION=-